MQLERIHVTAHAHDTTPPRESRYLVVGLIGLGLNGGLNLNIVPLLSGTLIDEGRLDATEAGEVLSVQALVAALAAIVLSSRTHLISARTVGLGAGVAVFVATLGFAWVQDLWPLLATSALLGVSLGVLGACFAAAIAAAPRVDRTAAIVSVGISLLVTVLTFPLARAVGAGGRSALFLVDLAIVAGSMLLMLALPAGRSASAPRHSTSLVNALIAPIVLVSIFLAIGTNGIWAFCERIGVGLGLSTERVGEVLAGSATFAVFGGAVAALVSRVGLERMWAKAGVATYGITSAAIVFAPNSTWFIVAICAQAFFFVFATPFLVAVAIGEDDSGGLVVAAAGWSGLLGAGAPALAGFMIEGGVLSGLGWFALATTVAALIALAVVGRNRGIVRSLAQ